MRIAEKLIQNLLRKADIQVNGLRPWDIRVHHSKFFTHVLAGGALALGESYMDGWWDVKNLDLFFFKLMYAELRKNVASPATTFNSLKSQLMNLQTMRRSTTVAKQHYDLGNDFYGNMLGKRMQYTCGYWKHTKSLDKAQEQKLELCCRKLHLEKGDKVLELGSGWGGFAKYAAEQYSVQVVSYNISAEQVRYARNLCKGLPVKIMHADYRTATGSFDKVASIGLCEHVGYKNYREFMLLSHRSLKKHGLFLLHTIGSDRSVVTSDPWFDKYIFPHGMLPSVAQLGKSFDDLFVLEDWHNFGPDYDKTLMAWFYNFNKSWPLFEKRYGNRFYRMWSYYLLSLAGSFRARKVQLWQIVLAKDGTQGHYEPVR